MYGAFIHGFFLALGLILPLGVQNLFIFNQGFTRPNFRQVVPVVMVAALCDTSLILLAVCGVSLLVLKIAWLKNVITWMGIAFLVYMGWVTWCSQLKLEQEPEPEHSANTVPTRSGRQAVLFTMSVSLLNPHAILDTIGVIGTNSIAYAGTAKLTYTLACILVSWVWFFTLASLGRLLGSADKTGKMRMLLNKVSAIIMWISAGYLLVGR